MVHLFSCGPHTTHHMTPSRAKNEAFRSQILQRVHNLYYCCSSCTSCAFSHVWGRSLIGCVFSDPRPQQNSALSQIEAFNPNSEKTTFRFVLLWWKASSMSGAKVVTEAIHHFKGLCWSHQQFGENHSSNIFYSTIPIKIFQLKPADSMLTKVRGKWRDDRCQLVSFQTFCRAVNWVAVKLAALKP